MPLISSWESQTNPRIPPLSRLEGYAAVFATPRSFDGPVPRRLDQADMTDGEKRAMTELRQELQHLRSEVLRAGSADRENVAVEPARAAGGLLASGPWHFPDGATITIVCAQWPPDMMKTIPYTKVDDPDYIELLKIPDLDALFELHGHLRAVNPGNQVNLRTVGNLAPDDYSTHLVSLGGVDWNRITATTLNQLPIPVEQITDWEKEDPEAYFEVKQDDEVVRYQPDLVRDAALPKGILRSDVALFARAVSPFNRERTVSICNGMYGRGTYGVVRALTDANFRERNATYLSSHFGDSDAYCVLTRVRIEDGVTLTPDWTTGDYILYEWAG